MNGGSHANGGAAPREFHDPAVLQNTWQSTLQPEQGCGLVNLGNTCFLNSVLQCLVGTPALMNLIGSKHSHEAMLNQHDIEQDWYVTFEKSLMRMLNSPGKSLRPIPFTKTVCDVIKTHRHGEQEDAHEYLVNLLERLHKHAMDAYLKIHRLNEEWLKKNRHMDLTSSINQIFGGIIRSQVMCKSCGNASNAYDPFTNLSLELKDCSTVNESLMQFTKVRRG
jgi:ubiquitin carboxyl-terminal hydrolase 36/42